jgi:hypothetical protein
MERVVRGRIKPQPGPMPYSIALVMYEASTSWSLTSTSVPARATSPCSQFSEPIPHPLPVTRTKAWVSSNADLSAAIGRLVLLPDI